MNGQISSKYYWLRHTNRRSRLGRERFLQKLQPPTHDFAAAALPADHNMKLLSGPQKALALDACADEKIRRDQEEETQTSLALNQDTLCFELEVLVVCCLFSSRSHSQLSTC